MKKILLAFTLVISSLFVANNALCQKEPVHSTALEFSNSCAFSNFKSGDVIKVYVTSEYGENLRYFISDTNICPDSPIPYVRWIKSQYGAGTLINISVELYRGSNKIEGRTYSYNETSSNLTITYMVGVWGIWGNSGTLD